MELMLFLYCGYFEVFESRYREGWRCVGKGGVGRKEAMGRKSEGGSLGSENGNGSSGRTGSESWLAY